MTLAGTPVPICDAISISPDCNSRALVPSCLPPALIFVHLCAYVSFSHLQKHWFVGGKWNPPLPFRIHNILWQGAPQLSYPLWSTLPLPCVTASLFDGREIKHRISSWLLHSCTVQPFQPQLPHPRPKQQEAGAELRSSPFPKTSLYSYCSPLPQLGFLHARTVSTANKCRAML